MVSFVFKESQIYDLNALTTNLYLIIWISLEQIMQDVHIRLTPGLP